MKVLSRTTYIPSDLFHHLHLLAFMLHSKLHLLSGTTGLAILLLLSFTNFKLKILLSFLLVLLSLYVSKKLPFLLSSRVTTTPLELVHCDIWDPAPAASLLGFRYYIVFIDDYSRFHWPYPLKHKSDSLVCFQHFKQINENRLIPLTEMM